MNCVAWWHNARKMTGLATQAKNRLHAVLQRHHLLPPEGNPFQSAQQEWWLTLPLGKAGKAQSAK